MRTMNNELVKPIVYSYGTPAYILDLAKFNQNYHELHSEYKKIYDKFEIAYSFKTNYTPVICKSVLQMGGMAEVVSEMEYRLAKTYGFPPERIMVNGPGKWSGLEEMTSDATNIMLDNEYELDRVLDLSNKTDKRVKIGFRLNYSLSNGKKSRFGFDVGNCELEKSVDKARNNKNIEIIGIHYHLSGARSVESWIERANSMIEFAHRFFEPEEIQVIDLGSGMFGHMHPAFASQFDQSIPSFRDYAVAVAGIFQNQYGHMPNELRPTLIVEPGTTVVANTMRYATKVIAEKSIRGKNIAIVDGSVHQLGEIGRKKRLPIEVVYSDKRTDRKEHVALTGYTCLEDDILCADLEIPAGVGDVIIFENTGAYTNVLKPPFIQPGCKIVAINEEGRSILAKRDESFEDIITSYNLE